MDKTSILAIDACRYILARIQKDIERIIILQEFALWNQESKMLVRMGVLANFLH